MPLDGDRAFAGETAGQSDERKKSSSSPIRRPARAAGVGGIHGTGNPRGAHKIIPGGVRPQNNLNVQRGSSGATYQQQGLPPRKRVKPSQPQLHYANRGGNMRSSPSCDPIEDADVDLVECDIDGTTNGYSSVTKRGHRGHASLSPIRFLPERQAASEASHAEKYGDTRTNKKRRAQDDFSDRWTNSSATDPQPTSFRKTRQVASSPIPVPPSQTRKPGPSKIEPSKDGNFLRLKTIWCGKLSYSDKGTTGTLVLRLEDPGLSVVIGKVVQNDLCHEYENIAFAVRLDDENPEFRNFVSLKLKNRPHNLLPFVLIEFRSLPDPAAPGQEPDCVLFTRWLEKQGVKVESKNHLYMKKRMEETKQCQYASPRETNLPQTETSSGAPWQSPQSIIRRQVAAKSQPGEVERPRTRSNPIAPVGSAQLVDLEQPESERAIRKSVRVTYKREVVEIPKPKPPPFPTQSWNQDLRFPFLSPGNTDTLNIKSLRTLDFDEFLNDEIINFQLSIVKTRLANEKPELASKVHIANTYFYTGFSSKTPPGPFSYEKVRRWTRNANLAEKELIFIPVNEKYHWFVVVICNLPGALAAAKAREKRASVEDELIAIESSPQKQKPAAKNRPVRPEQCAIVILDSMAGVHIPTLKIMKNYLISEVKDKNQITLEPDDFTGLMPRKLPGQDNFSDCGVFMLHYIEKWLSEPAKIKEKLYERDFGSEEEARKLWSISEVASKREKMWRLYVKLNEEFEKCLKEQPFNEFPEIDDTPIAYKKSPNREGADTIAKPADTNTVTIDRPATPARATQELLVMEDVKRPTSPAKRKSDTREEEIDRPSKRAKSDSPVIVDEQPRPIAAPGLKPRVPSPEIPFSSDVPYIQEVPETQEDDLHQRANALANSDVPLIAANGLVPLASPDHPMPDLSLIDEIEQVGNFNPTAEERQPPIVAEPQAPGAETPAMVAANSFDYLSISNGLRDRVESEGTAAMTVDPIMPDAPPSKPIVDDIEDTEDESIGELRYNGGITKGKSYELQSDQIRDTPSSQDHREEVKSHKHKETDNHWKGTAHDPICLDSQSSPKRTSPRTKAPKASRP
ncbi:hypothetical protein TWF481_011240 [Arthrobotrys musiformis]|uniref:Ubiquitin-like protease family profile domain-containing protein n=1 Tax=Arthrobotrys musiformis TaxID=47236 RepID=A0AAV9VZ81_9PEZI